MKCPDTSTWLLTNHKFLLQYEYKKWRDDEQKFSSQATDVDVLKRQRKFAMAANMSVRMRKYGKMKKNVVEPPPHLENVHYIFFC